MLLFFQGVYQLREFKSGKSPVEIPGPDWWAKRPCSGGAMSEAYARYRVAIAPKLLQQGVDETMIHGRPNMNQFISVPRLHITGKCHGRCGHEGPQARGRWEARAAKGKTCG